MDGKSKDMTQEYIEQLKALFPEAVTEVADKEGNKISHKVDMEKLAILLGEAAIPADETEYRQKYGEKFSFEWAGKRRAIAEAQKRSMGTLLPCPAESVEWDDTENLYVEGDNLEVLKLLQDSYLGAVKMIYIDPPYNTGKDFVYKDDYRDNLSNYIEMTNTTNAVNSEASGRYHTNWLNMMYPRLKLARNLLTDDGVIFISIDDNEVSNLKSICDEIFGEDNFQGQFIVNSTPNARDYGHIGKMHEYILFYSKHSSFTTTNMLPEIDKTFKYNDEKGGYNVHPLYNSNEAFNNNNRPNLFYPFYLYLNEPIGDNFYKIGLEPKEKSITIYPPLSQKNNVQFVWRWGKDKSAKNINAEIIGYKTAGGEYRIIQKMRHSEKIIRSLFIDTKYSTRRGTAEVEDIMEGKIFSFPKPLSLISDLIKAGSDAESIIVDICAGSATTAHAVMQLNAEDGGNRKYICVQLPEPTPEDSDARKAGYNTIPEIAKERIRRAGKKILEEQKAKNDGLFAKDAPKLDIGFKVFKLDRSNVKEWDVEFDGLSEKQAEQQLKAEFSKAMDILKDGRTELDLLYEVMLKLGLQLSTTVEAKQIEDKTVFVVGHGVMIASFAKGLTSAQIGKIVDLKADFIQASEFKVVLSDESFASDNDKTNAMQLFKQRGITNYEII